MTCDGVRCRSVWTTIVELARQQKGGVSCGALPHPIRPAAGAPASLGQRAKRANLAAFVAVQAPLIPAATAHPARKAHHVAPPHMGECPLLALAAPMAALAKPAAIHHKRLIHPGRRLVQVAHTRLPLG